MEQWLLDAERKINIMKKTKAYDIREQCLSDLAIFAQIMNPTYCYGEIHLECFRWMQSNNDINQLLLVPRAHLKSHMIAVYAVWYITTRPDTSILYISATSTLAETQLKAIKDIFETPQYRRFFPDMINPEEGQREKWTNGTISVDHPTRKAKQRRDATISTAGLTTNTTGWHADVILADDVVVPGNAYTEEGRRNVSSAMSQMVSIRNAGGFTKAVGTRYHPSDIYDTWKKQKMVDYDLETSEVIGESPVWDIKEEVVEEDGIFLWPRTIVDENDAYGFNLQVLSRVKAEYDDVLQFYSQYYNNPNGQDTQKISRDKFQYLNPKKLKFDGSKWWYGNDIMNVYASIDFAFSTSHRADYTAIVVIGMANNKDIFVLDIDRFKTNKPKEYFKHVLELHNKWNFKKLRAEITGQQIIIVNNLKDFIKEEGCRISIEEHKPTRHDGKKEERISAALDYKYDNLSIWHTAGGYTKMLEEELVLTKPPHDDIKDALASAVEIATPPAKQTRKNDELKQQSFVNARFGGISFR